MHLDRRRTCAKIGRRRAAEFIEFAILLPFFIFFITFAVDMGRITMLQAALQDAVQQVARGGAQNGGWDAVNPLYCPPPIARSTLVPNQSTGQPLGCTGVPLTIINSALDQTPFGNHANLLLLNSYASADGTAYSAPYCQSNAEPYVVAQASYNVSGIFLTPGLYRMMGVALGNYNWTLNATAVARVDVCH
jgi:hypothetical protein